MILNVARDVIYLFWKYFLIDVMLLFTILLRIYWPSINVDSNDKQKSLHKEHVYGKKKKLAIR